MIGERFNFEDVFFRDLTVCVLDTLEGQVKWTNRFSSGDVHVQVPFYYSLTGDERFLLDSFSDDVVSENRYVELNTDTIPRGHLTLTGFNIKSDEFANPNVWLRMVVENEREIRKILSKVRAIPITVNYDLEILLTSEIDTFKASQSIMDVLWVYKYMYFEYNFMNIDAIMIMPDSNTIQMVREKNLTSDNKISLKVSFTVETYYPAWRPDKVGGVGYEKKSGDGMVDLSNTYSSNGISDLNDLLMGGKVSDYFYQPDGKVKTNKVYTTSGTSATSGSSGSTSTSGTSATSGSSGSTSTSGTSATSGSSGSTSTSGTSATSGSSGSTSTSGTSATSGSSGSTSTSGTSATSGSSGSTSTSGTSATSGSSGSTSTSGTSATSGSSGSTSTSGSSGTSTSSGIMGSSGTSTNLGTSGTVGTQDTPETITPITNNTQQVPFNYWKGYKKEIYGEDDKFLSTGSAVSGSDYYGSSVDKDMILPKRTKWFDNILRSRERMNGKK